MGLWMRRGGRPAHRAGPARGARGRDLGARAVLAVGAAAAVAFAAPAGAWAGAAGGAELSTQGVVTLLARRYDWIWKVPPDRLQVREVRTADGAARLVWVSSGDAGAQGEGVRHAFGMLGRQAAGERDVFVDLTPLVDTGYPAYTIASLDLLPGGPSVFAVGAPSAASRPQAALYLFDPSRAGGEASSVRVLQATGDLITLDREPGGELRVQVGRYDFGERVPGVFVVSDSARLDPVGRPARAVAVTTYRWDPARRAFAVEASPPELTPFGVAEAFVAAVRRGDMQQALALTTAEWRRVMGVDTPERLRAYLQATRPHLLLSPGPFRFLGGTAGREAASILFTDPEGRIYRIRLRLVSGQAPELMVVQGAATPELRGPWQVDGLDGGS